MPKILRPLEGSDKTDSVEFGIYDRNGRTLWGWFRVRRVGNPDYLVCEVRRPNETLWHRLLELTAVEDQLLVATHGIRGGKN